MATAFYTVRVENQYGEYFETEYEYDFNPEEWDGEPFDPMDTHVQQSIYEDVMQNIYVDLDFDRLED